MTSKRQRSASYVRSLMQAGPKVKMHSLGDGLILRVGKSGSASYLQRIQVHGRRRDIALGSVRVVSLAEARRMAAANKARAILGAGEPVGVTGRRAAAKSTCPVFRDFAAKVIETKAAEWKRPTQRRAWEASIDRWTGPIASLPLDQIRRTNILELMNQPVENSTLWLRHNSAASTTLQRVAVILNVAVARELIQANPANRDAIKAALPKVNTSANRKHFDAIPYQDLGAFVDRVAAECRNSAASLAVRFLALTATRCGEAVGARWDEIDVQSGLWTIPPSRSKTNREHTVMLSEPALKVLQEAKALRNHSDYVFPGRVGKPVSSTTLRRSFSGSAGTPHGLRSAFRDWAAEKCPNMPGDVAERALGHVVGNQVTQAYLRTTLDEQRHDLMQKWGSYLDF